jgi:hypothetical protein
MQMEHRITTPARTYIFGASFGEISGHEAEVRAALERAEHSTEPYAIRDTITLIAMGGLPMVMMPTKAAKNNVTVTMEPVEAPAKKRTRPSRAKAKLELDQQAMPDRVDDSLPHRKKERYSKKEAAWLLDMSVSSLEYRARQREITIKRDGGRRYVTQAEIDRYKKRDHHALIRSITPRKSGG